jgi:tRNA/rRNA methyltransferase
MKNSIAVVFGSEKEGLTNEELSLCRLYAGIPSSKSFPSLNLAQAVMVICYELFHSTVESSAHTAGLAQATRLEKMFEHMENTLKDTGFLDPDHPTRMMRGLRRLFGKSQLDEREVQILQGIWSSVDWCLRRQKDIEAKDG